MNKLAVITGGSDGIGRALVLELANKGLDIITCGRSGDKLDSLKSEFPDSSNLIAIEGDLTNKDDFNKFNSIVEEFVDKIDVLVNNAGMQISNSLLENINIEDMKAMEELHTFVPLKLYKTIAPTMKKKESGMIMNISSVVVKGLAKETHGPYITTKYSQYGLSKMMVEEVSKYNIRITNVIMGGADTNIRQGDPRPQYLKPSDIAVVLGNIVCGPKDVFIPEIYLYPKVQLPK